jgi:hypothetical protein
MTTKEKERIRSIARQARDRGRLERHPCEFCLAPNSEMHHVDYKYPLMVRWLCHTCHMSLHTRKSDVSLVP